MRRVRSFVLREGRLTHGQRKALDTLWPRYGLERAQGVLDARAEFGRDAPRVLEIGYGMGQSLAGMAEAEPDKDFIGIEVHRPGVGKLINDAHQAGVTNLRVYCDDAIDVLQQCIADNSLDGVQLYFPDPWHKKRHNKRRIVQPEFAQRIRSKLKVGGTFHMATDWEPYAEHMMEVMAVAEGYENQAGGRAFSPRPDHRPITKFERRGERLGHGVWDLIFTKTS